MISNVGVVGAGTMGNGIAQVFAQSGFSVTLVDIAVPMLDRAKAAIDKSLAKFVEKHRISAAERDDALGRLSTATRVDKILEVRVDDDNGDNNDDDDGDEKGRRGRKEF